MRGEEGDDHGGGEGEICGVGAAAAAEEVAADADAEHAEGDGGERSAEEAHGGSGEVEDVAEGEIVELRCCRPWRGVRRCRLPGAGWGAVTAKYAQTRATSVARGTRSVEVPVEGAAIGRCVLRWMMCGRLVRGGRRP